ncbi:hypothetical protein ALQ75_05465 [Pseudomonas savastanoi pv. glycinea]|nr:hypothetical protein ALQ75_05465 [Pseudomonas savastanoi pv. glycinea]
MVTGVDRAFQGQHGKHVLLNLVTELTQFFQAHFCQVLAGFHAIFHGMTDDLVAVTERQTTAHQIVGQIGRGREPAQRGFTHDRVPGFDCRDHVGKRTQRITQSVGSVKQRFLVFLIVLVVGQRLAFHQGQQAHQGTEHTAALATYQFRHIRVFLLRHDRAASTEAIRQINELELRTGPEHQLFGEARQVHHRDGRGRAEFDGEVAIRYAVQRITAHDIETQQFAGQFAVDRVGGACQRSAAQRHAVETLAAVDQTLVVAAEHFEPGQHMMTECNGLGSLQMGETGHDGFSFALGLAQQALLQTRDFAQDQVDFVAQPQTDIGRDLIVAAATGVQLLAGDTNAIGQACFNVHVHIFQIDAPLEIAGLDLGLDGVQAVNDGVTLGVRQNAHLGQHRGVGDGAHDVVAIQTLIEGDGGSETRDKRVDGFTEAAAPGLIGLVGAHGFARC